MRLAWMIAGLGALLAAGQVSAQTCPCTGGSRLNQTQLATALGNRTVCAAVDGEIQQEFHTGTGSTAGALVAYKRGPGHAVDPSETVGTWIIVGTGASATVRYNYTGGGVYQYSVCGATGGPYTYCGEPGSRNFAGITTVAGPTPAPCPGATLGSRAPMPASR